MIFAKELEVLLGRSAKLQLFTDMKCFLMFYQKEAALVSFRFFNMTSHLEKFSTIEIFLILK